MLLESWRSQSNGGDKAAKNEIKRYLDENPDICMSLGDISLRSMTQLISMITDGDFLIGEALRRQMDAFLQKLSGPCPTLLESLAAKRVIASWLLLHYVEKEWTSIQGDLLTTASWIKIQNQAQCSYNAAVKMLLLIHKCLSQATPSSTPAEQTQLHTLPNSEKEYGQGGNGSVPPKNNTTRKKNTTCERNKSKPPAYLDEISVLLNDKPKINGFKNANRISDHAPSCEAAKTDPLVMLNRFSGQG